MLKPNDGSCDALEASEVAPPDPIQDATSVFGHDVRQSIATAMRDLQAAAHLKPGQLLIVGASSSEVIGRRIGTATSIAIGRMVTDAVFTVAREYGLHIAVQCCEHLNRSLVIESSVAMKLHLPVVDAIPVPGAGGAVASVAYFAMENPVLVSSLQADAGVDIGDTLIGMHLKPIAVPVRSSVREIGQAHLTMARCRPPLIGGPRAVYDVEEARRRLVT